jgi:hypothetical protein
VTSPAPEPSTSSAGPEFAGFVVDQLELEEKRRASLETRGLAIITTSGTLVTLLLALAALVTQRKDYQLPDPVGTWLTAALIAFVVAAAFAIGANAPQLYRTIDVTALKIITRSRWNSASGEALKTLTATRLEELQRAQAVNSVKAYLLLGAAVAQGAAIGSLTMGVTIIVR